MSRHRCGEDCEVCARRAEAAKDERETGRSDYMTDREMDGRAADMVYGRWDA